MVHSLLYCVGVLYVRLNVMYCIDCSVYFDMQVVHVTGGSGGR